MRTTATLQPTSARSVGVDRDPAIDLLRAGALGVVVLGHWLLTVVHWHHGSVTARNLLDVEPVTQWATWPFQVMPLFFAVGGWAAARSWATGSTGRRRTDGVAARLRRLLVPVTTYVVAASLLAAGVQAVFGATAGAVSGLLGMHLWFLAVFIPVTAVMPLLCAATVAHDWRVPLGLGTAVVAVDLARFVVGVPGIGWANFALVWLAFTALGAAAAIRPPRPDRLVSIAAGAFATLVVVVAAGWYPHSMVGIGERSNNTPPTVALGLSGLTQVCLAAAALTRLRRGITRRPRVRRGIAGAGLVGMHVYLWHLCATVVVVAVMRTGVGNIEPLSVTWWATRPVWWGVLAAITAPIVVVALRVDRRRLQCVAAPREVSTARVVTATVLAAAALAVLAVDGVGFEGASGVAVGGLLAAGRLVGGGARLFESPTEIGSLSGRVRVERHPTPPRPARPVAE